MLSWDMQVYAKARYNLLGKGDHWFPGERADKLAELDLGESLKESPHADRIPALLAEIHESLSGEAVARLSQQ